MVATPRPPARPPAAPGPRPETAVAESPPARAPRPPSAAAASLAASGLQAVAANRQTPAIHALRIISFLRIAAVHQRRSGDGLPQRAGQVGGCQIQIIDGSDRA